MRIKTERSDLIICPDEFRWTAVDDATYGGPGSPIGTGATEEEAVADLLEQIEEAQS